MVNEKRAPLESAEVAANRLGKVIAERLPQGWGFVMALCTFTKAGEDGGMATWISSIEREAALHLLEEILHIGRGDVRAGVNPREPSDHTVPKCWCCGSKEQLTKLQGSVRSVALCPECLASTH